MEKFAPRTISLVLDWLPIEANIDRIDEPARSVCHRILVENRPLFELVRGSTHNHQAWPGGYIDHITDGMNYGRHLYAFNAAFGRPLPYTESDLLLAFFIHDLEKPWRIEIGPDGIPRNRAGLQTKTDFQNFRAAKLAEYELVLTPAQENGYMYAEGELHHYMSTRRIMNELAANTHQIDNWCARGWHGYPLDSNDPWTGARRVRTVSQ
jgi:hypothetical protein